MRSKQNWSIFLCRVFGASINLNCGCSAEIKIQAVSWFDAAWRILPHNKRWKQQVVSSEVDIYMSRFNGFSWSHHDTYAFIVLHIIVANDGFSPQSLPSRHKKRKRGMLWRKRQERGFASKYRCFDLAVMRTLSILRVINPTCWLKTHHDFKTLSKAFMVHHKKRISRPR